VKFFLLLSIHWLLLVSRKRLQLLHIDTLQLRAVKASNHLANGTQERIKRVQKNVRLSLSSKLVDEASKVVALCECLRIEDASSEVGNVDAGEGVGCAGVSAHY
jgi:hypothetical protein